MTEQNVTFNHCVYMKNICPPYIDKYLSDYDAAGRLPGYTHFNGTKTNFGYDNASRLTAITNQKQDDSTISSYAYTLDGNGNRTGITQNEPYSAALSEGEVTYTYNTQKNRLVSAGATSYTYDDEGQLATDNSNTYTFDYEHRLKTIGSTTTFYYDGSGNRLKATRNGTTTKYIYDAAGRLIAETDNNNNITRYYIYGSGLLAAVTPEGQAYCYHYNGIGSAIAITDSTQAVVNKYSYDAFGNIANQQEAITQPFKYVGQAGVMTEPNGFYYMKARYYDPVVGRFISEDPTGFDGGDVNLMAYVGNNPINMIDPSGEAKAIFNGKVISLWTDKGKYLGSWNATSGQGGNISEAGKGPIPPGLYFAEPGSIQTVSIFSPVWYFLRQSSWGEQRLSLTAMPQTETYGRSGFFIHGGAGTATAGCIKINDERSFFNAWQKTDEMLWLNVNYEKGSGK